MMNKLKDSILLKINILNESVHQTVLTILSFNNYYFIFYNNSKVFKLFKI